MAERTINPVPKPALGKPRRGKRNVGGEGEARATSKEEQFEELLTQGVDEHEAREMVWGSGPTTGRVDMDSKEILVDQPFDQPETVELDEGRIVGHLDAQPDAPPKAERAPRRTRAEQRLQEISARGLGVGSHDTPAEGYCVLEAFSIYAGQRFSWHPKGVSPAIQRAAVAVNDALGDGDRNDLIPLIPRLAGTDDPELERPREQLLAHLLLLKAMPQAIGEERYLATFATEEALAKDPRQLAEAVRGLTMGNDLDEQTEDFLLTYAGALELMGAEGDSSDAEEPTAADILGTCLGYATSSGFVGPRQAVSLVGDLIACPRPTPVG